MSASSDGRPQTWTMAGGARDHAARMTLLRKGLPTIDRRRVPALAQTAP